jgi:hypothetical protein
VPFERIRPNVTLSIRFPSQLMVSVNVASPQLPKLHRRSHDRAPEDDSEILKVHFTSRADRRAISDLKRSLLGLRLFVVDRDPQ